jgi:hypothetical protein
MLSFDLSGKGGPTSSYTTAGISLWIIAPRKGGPTSSYATAGISRWIMATRKSRYPAEDAFVKVLWLAYATHSTLKPVQTLSL